jgi:hypothetical protein
MLRKSHLLIAAVGILFSLAIPAKAEESAGQAEVGFQYYYLSIGAHRAADIAGISAVYREFIPSKGLLSASVSPALSNDRFRTGEDYLRLTGLPWHGHYWTFGIGDFTLTGQLVPSPFSNVYVPQIAGRGYSAEARHGGRTIGFFSGTETIADTPRVVLRLALPERIQGIYFRQIVGKRVVLGARYLRFTNNLAELQKSPYTVVQTRDIKQANTFYVDALYTSEKHFKWYTESGWSHADDEKAGVKSSAVPFSGTTGPLLETSVFTLRANYTFQNAAYFPLLGYYVGDRRGPFAEASIRPVHGLELFASASKYGNNVAQDPGLPTFRSVSESAGFSLRLPAKFSLNGQLTTLELLSRDNAGIPWTRSKNKQETATLMRPVGHHSLRFTVRDFRQESLIVPQGQRSVEFEDLLHWRRFVAGGGARLQRSTGTDSRSTVYYRGLGQIQMKRFSAYANFETGNDMQNRTVFALNAINTETFGASLMVSKEWELQAEAYRNNLVTALNPQNIFILQGQGVSVPGTLASLNQWSFNFRLTHKISWGKAGGQDLNQYASSKAALKGSVEGFVVAHGTDRDKPVEGVPVSIDDDRTVATGKDGRYRFADVPEGAHRINLALTELPAEFDAGTNAGATVAVHAGKLTRVDLDVNRLGAIEGSIRGPQDAKLDEIKIKLANTGRYTTTDDQGIFHFYNLRAGDYQVVIDKTSLPEDAELQTPGSAAIMVDPDLPGTSLSFSFAIHRSEKPVRRISIP